MRDEKMSCGLNDIVCAAGQVPWKGEKCILCGRRERSSFINLGSTGEEIPIVQPR